MTEIDVRGIIALRDIDWNRHKAMMGFGDIVLPELEITLRGCALMRSGGQIIALPPKVPGAKPSDLGAIQWRPSGKFAMRVRDALLAAYKKMDGEMPPESEPVRRDHITGKPIGPDPFAIDPERATKHRPDDMPADALEQAAKAAAHARRHAVARTATDENDDLSGLHRTLGVCAVEETMEKAGL